MIDIIFAILMIIALIKGYKKGLVVAIFSIIAFVIGLAAALKLSAAVTHYLHPGAAGASKWLPVLSFIVVFVIVAFLIHLGGKLIEKSFEMILLGWANRIGGILLYALLYTIIFSVFLFYTDKIKLFDNTTLLASKSYPVVHPIGPKVMDGVGKMIPICKDTFAELEVFFAGISNKIPQ